MASGVGRADEANTVSRTTTSNYRSLGGMSPPSSPTQLSIVTAIASDEGSSPED
ncbi:hypothetical protein BDN67DRAFT_1018014 [Paxillus ammoniavirescens]|nr:hypothetical protein BDN67DRAFT_1018014 [Paxillus ammoniavirescens]